MLNEKLVLEMILKIKAMSRGYLTKNEIDSFKKTIADSQAITKWRKKELLLAIKRIEKDHTVYDNVVQDLYASPDHLIRTIGKGLLSGGHNYTNIEHPQEWTLSMSKRAVKEWKNLYSLLNFATEMPWYQLIPYVSGSLLHLYFIIEVSGIKPQNVINLSSEACKSAIWYIQWAIMKKRKKIDGELIAIADTLTLKQCIPLFERMELRRLLEQFYSTYQKEQDGNWSYSKDL